MPGWAKKLGAIVGALLIVFSLYSATDAATTARDTADSNKRTVAELRHQQWETRNNNYHRAVAACVSSTEFRNLLNDLDRILIPLDTADPEAAKAHDRIHQYTDNNPNCVNLPPRPGSEPELP